MDIPRKILCQWLRITNALKRGIKKACIAQIVQAGHVRSALRTSIRIFVPSKIEETNIHFELKTNKKHENQATNQKINYSTGVTFGQGDQLRKGETEEGVEVILGITLEVEEIDNNSDRLFAFEARATS
uniref:Uncharacterized protein n=1 Tax=Romanomermis culicivorax TaxID=13658 RepID=A0A915IEC2_ROMCU